MVAAYEVLTSIRIQSMIFIYCVLAGFAISRLLVLHSLSCELVPRSQARKYQNKFRIRRKSRS